MYKEVRDELKKRLEGNDNDIDLKIAAHILAQRWIMHHGLLMWRLDIEVFEKMKQPCLLDSMTGRFLGNPTNPVDTFIQEWSKWWGEAISMTMEELEFCN